MTLIRAAGFAVCMLFLGPALASTSAKTFENPIIPGYHPDPSIVRVGPDFYLTNSTFEYFPGLPIYHSRDLVHWEYLCNALDRPSQLPLKGAASSGGLFAPTIRYDKGKFYLVCTNTSNGGNFFVTAGDPKGPWSEPVWLKDFGMDPSLFFDNDGRVFFTRFGGESILQAQIDVSLGKFLTPLRPVWSDKTESWNEGPHLYKIRGKYFLMLAEGGTGPRHMEAVGRSDSPWGPFEPCPYNPILTQRDTPVSPIQCSGHGDLVEAPDGTWWMVFLAVRPQNGASVLGRETCLAPVTWTKDNWPVVNGDHHVALKMPAPKLALFFPPVVPDRRVFKPGSLGPEWIHVRNPEPADISLAERPGWLRLHGNRANLDERDAPAFAGIRQPGFNARARTLLEFSPKSEGEEAGICIRANDDNHCETGLCREGGRTYVFARTRIKGESMVMAKQDWKGGGIQLEIRCLAGQYQMAFGPVGKAASTLYTVKSEDYAPEHAGGFTGAVVGLYATGNGHVSQSPADFNWLDLAVDQEPKPLALSAMPSPTPVAARDAWRLRAGGKAWKDSQGNQWLADCLFQGGQTGTSDREVKGTTDSMLYQSDRWAAKFSYSLPVKPGTYKVTARFAETFWDKAGERVLKLSINGKPVLGHMDIYAKAGGKDRAVDFSFSHIAPGPGGRILLEFEAEKENAKVCALEVVRE